MAGWRDRGYVVDSDEEDEASNETDLQIPTSERPQDVDRSQEEDNGAGVWGSDCVVADTAKELKTKNSTGKGRLDMPVEARTVHIGGYSQQTLKEQSQLGRVVAGHLCVDGEAPMLSGISVSWDHNEKGTGRTTAAVELATESLDNVRQIFSIPSKTCIRNTPRIQPLLDDDLTSSLLTEPQFASVSDSEIPAPVAMLPLQSQSSSNGQDDLPPISELLDLDPPQLRYQSPVSHNHTVEPETSRGPVRALRQRKPVQLHPYAIEGEKYRQTLKARGVVPLRIAQVQARMANSLEKDSQEQFSDTEERSELAPDSAESQDALLSLSPGFDPVAEDVQYPVGQPSPNLAANNGEEFPNVDTLLRHHHRDVQVLMGHKRRKVGHKYHRRRNLEPSSPATKSAHRYHSDTIIDDDINMFDVPPSPPPSGSSGSQVPNQRKADVFRFPRGISPVHPQTPIASSESRARQVLDILEASGSQMDEAMSTTNSNGGNVYSRNVSLSPVLPPSATSPDLQRVQRTIKGVLPASWLRLDLKKQVGTSKQHDRDHRSLSPESHDERTGIARPVARSNNKVPTHTNPFTIDIDSDSGTEDENTELSHVPEATSVNVSLSPSRSMGYEWDVLMDNKQPITIDEAVEDDRIDGMFTAPRGPATRSGTQRGLDKNRQSRQSTSNKIRKPGDLARTSFKRTHNIRSHQPKITQHLKNVVPATKRTPRFIVPKFGIIDTSSLDGPPRHKLPPFIRIAARTSNLRNDKGRHIPSRKHIQLATRKDTEDANETLYRWREGKIAPKIFTSATLPTSDCSIRSPLRELSNIGSKLDRSRRVLENGALPVKLSRPPSSSSSRPHRTQASLNHLIREKSVKTGGKLTRKRLELAKANRRRSTQNGRGQLWSSLRDLEDSRLAQLETFATSNIPGDTQWTSPQGFLAIRQSHDEPHGSDLLLAKFFRYQDVEDLRQPLPRPMQNDISRDDPLLPSKVLFPHKTRKRHPRYVNVNVPGFKDNSGQEEIIDVPSDHDIASHSTIEETAVLTGLEAFGGTHYPIDFGIAHLPAGQFLPNGTFVGSGEFAKSMNLCKLRNLDDPAGYESFQHRNTLLEWGPWNEAVSSELSAVINGLCSRYEELSDKTAKPRSSLHQADNDLRYVVRYISNHLYFLDPIDRLSFLHRCRMLMLTIMDELGDDINIASVITSNSEPLRQLRLRIFLLVLVIANQLQQISEHVLVPMTIGNDIKLLVNAALRKTLRLTLQGRYEELRMSFQGMRTDHSSEQGTPFIACRIEAFIVARDVANHLPETKQAFNEMLEERIIGSLKNSTNVKEIETGWASLFSLLPMLGIDSLGYVTSGQPQEAQQEHWEMVKRLTHQVLRVYVANPRGQGSTFNAYCRAIFARCLHLINFWGWYRCETIIGTLFDFFARNKLAHLRNERSHGSPTFLENLDSDPKLALAAEDLCFHILLKVIGSGLHHLRCILPEKKTRDLVWRLMPNHGRLYPKDESVKQGDLDALQNHHDLLCTLYWASPEGLRPRVSAIQNLVDLASSHQVACHIHIRAWSNLVRFQLSTSEGVVNLLPFAKWHQALLKQLLSLHHVARTEVEEQVRNAALAGAYQVSKEVVESTISKNQRHVESILRDALVSLRNTVSAAKGQEVATTLLSPSLTEVFELFSATRPRTNEVVIGALDVVQAYSEHTMFKASQNESRGLNEKDDSQDYGDWSLFTEDITSTSNLPTAAEHLLNVVHEPLRQLLSNCFGADNVPEDQLLSRMVDTWIHVARLVITADKASWNDYIGSFGQATWTSLRDTEHTRRYTAYFLARVVESDKASVTHHKDFFLKSWIASLVERESLIKFQHQLTASLLNAVPDEPLLLNLPFYKNQVSGKFIISASDFRSRRIMLISCLLSNMHMSIEAASYDRLSEAANLRQEYREYLKHLMAVMKHNYQELGPSTDVNGSYVGFAHQVVGFLQQYTSEICPVDRFFTDSTGFPLPARDPTYVVGRLKSYSLRLQDSRTPKQLVTFIQAISERAAVDNQQPYLVNQVGVAMSSQYEEGDSTKPTLRSFLVSAVFPSYIDLAFTTTCGWIIAIPLLQALETAFDNLLVDVDGTIIASRNAVTATVHNALHSLQKAMYQSVDKGSGLCRHPAMLRVLTAGFAMTTVALPVLDYISRVSGLAEEIFTPINFFEAFGTFVFAQLENDNDINTLPQVEPLPTPANAEWAEARRFALAELKLSLDKNWVCCDRQYYVIKGGSRKQITTALGSEKEERDGLLFQIEAFSEGLRAMPAYNGGEGCGSSEVRPCLGMSNLVI